MPRPSKPARLWLRPGTKERGAVWVILDGGKQLGTGCGADDVAGAEKALSQYVARKLAEAPAEKHRAASDVKIAEVVAHYVTVKAATSRRPEEMAARFERLLLWWGNRTLDDIDSKTCAAYTASRTTPTYARRELEDLRAACNLAVKDKLTRHSVTIALPPRPKGRTSFMGRDVVAKILWAAHRKREMQTRHRGADKGKVLPTKKKQLTHVARFMLTALYTGSRAGRVWAASFYKEDGRPFVDTDAGLFFRSWEGENVPLNKRAPPIRLPDRLLAHMRRWKAKGAKYVVEYEGRPADPKKAFRKLVDDTLGDDAKGVMRHTFRHTAATWIMQHGVDRYEASGFLGMSPKTLESVYGHHHPDHQKGVSNAFSRRPQPRKGA